MELQVISVSAPEIVVDDDDEVGGPEVASIYVPGPAGIAAVRAATNSQNAANQSAASAVESAGSAAAASLAAGQADAAAEAAAVASSSATISAGQASASAGAAASASVDAGNAAVAAAAAADSAATAASTASASASVAAGVERAVATAPVLPNLFDHHEYRALSKDRMSVVSGTLSLESYNGEPVLKLVTNGSGAGRFYRRFLRSELGSAVTMSAAIDVVAKDAGSSATFIVYQKNSGGSTLATNTATIGAAAISTPTTFRLTGISIVAGCVYVDVDIVCNKTNGDFSCAGRYRNPMLCAGSNGVLRPPPQFVVPNHFPDPDFFGFNATTFDGSRAVENNEVILNLSSSGATMQAIYQLAATGIFAPGNFLTLSAECYCSTTGASSSADVVVIFYDSSAAEISRTTQVNASSINTWHELRTFGTIPANTAYFTVRFVGRPAAATAKFRRTYLTNPAAAGYAYLPGANPGHGRNVQSRVIVYASTSGSDGTGDGSKANPFSTIVRAIKAAKPDGIVVVRAGTYDEAISVAGCLNLDLIAHPNEQVIINRGTLLSGFTKTAGRTYVYEASLSYDPYSPWCWEHGIPDPDTAITAAERHPCHRGLAYRLPSTRLHKQASIADVDAAPGGAYYWDSGANKIYIRTPNGSNPASNGRSYYVPSQNSGLSGGTGNECVRVTDIDFFYCGTGLNAKNLGYFEANNVTVIGSRLNGITLDETRAVVLRSVRSGGNGVDGINGHNYGSLGGGDPAGNPGARQMLYISHWEWSHDNADDGQSYHENGLPHFVGGLWEYNGDRGIATSYGAHGTCIAGTARYNGQLASRDDGSGFCAIGSVQSIDGGVGTQMELIDCRSYGNVRNYSVSGAADNIIIARNCTSRSATEAGYYADTGKIYAHDCKTDGEVAKLSASGGSITVITSTNLA